jgi:hypothetical protein
MGTFSISAYGGNQLLISYNPIEGDEITLNVLSLKSPSIEVKGKQFKFFESGIYKKTLNFNQIDTIGDSEPSDETDATEKILDLIATLNLVTILT